MSISVNRSAVVLGGSGTISLSQMVSVTAGGANPAYLVLTGLDRNEYTAAATGATGTLSGSGHTLGFSGIGGDGRGIGIVFTYDAATGQYYNSTYGYLSQLRYTASASLNDFIDLSLFGFSSAATAAAMAGDPYACMESDVTGYLGTMGIATQPGFSGSLPAQATPGLIASVAASFIGKAWNENGCWVLANTIAAEAGAALPVQSTEIGLPGQANGAWMVAFNGPAGQTGNWQSMVTAGDIVVIGNNAGLGHITTCVSGAGSSAMLIDNITYVDRYGNITNLANDGSASDVVVAAPHPASQEWASVLTSDVVVYRLDTPVVALTRTAATLPGGTALALQPYFSVSDPAGKPITQYQIYDTATGDRLTVNGTGFAAHSASAAVTVSSLSGVCLLGGAAACTDSVEVRAFNGAWWGDWQALTVAVSASVAPKLVYQTPNQTWQQGSRIGFSIAANAFSDPQHQTLSYTACLGNGQDLPSWLSFNSLTRSFSGVVPNAVQTLSLMVTATDTSGLSASETFQASVPAKPPTLLHQAAGQTWAEGSLVSFTLPAATFGDPQGEALQYSAMLANGQALPDWLSFNPSSGMFSGIAPYSAGSITLKLIATNTSGLSAAETFPLAVVVPPPVLTHQTADQAWTANVPLFFTLPADTFSAVPGQMLRYSARLSNGQGLPPGLVFDSTIASFCGYAPVKTGTYAITVTAAEANGLSASETFNAVVTASPPTITRQTATQTWIAGQKLALTLPADTFTDPQGEALRYTTTLADGRGLPSGISFNAATGTFSGTVPLALATNTIKVTATDASLLSAAETFQVAIVAAPPSVAAQMADQAWSAGQTVSLALPPNSFSDPQGQALRYSATQSNGQPLPRGLSFNPSTLTFSGTAPITPETLGLTVTATNASGLAGSGTFSVVVQSAAPVAARPLADQVWTDGQTMRFLLPGGSFSDPQKSALTYTAFQIGGPDQTSWLHFNASTADFTGLVPMAASGSIGIEVVATNAYGLSASETLRLSFAPAGSHLSAVPFSGSPTEMLMIHS